MSRVRNFEDLLAWQRAMDLAEHVYDACSSGQFSRDFALTNQMHRAAISAPSNIAEGFERGSRAEFHRFLSIAKGSCGEVRTQVHLAKRVGYLSDDRAAALLDEAVRLGQIIGKLRAKVAEQRSSPRVPRAAYPMP